jgi:hypothetical protein
MVSRNTTQVIDVASITVPNLLREKYHSGRTLDQPRYDARCLEEDNENLQQPLMTNNAERQLMDMPTRVGSYLGTR